MDWSRQVFKVGDRVGSKTAYSFSCYGDIRHIVTEVDGFLIKIDSCPDWLDGFEYYKDKPDE